MSFLVRMGFAVVLSALVAACSSDPEAREASRERQLQNTPVANNTGRSTIWDLFRSTESDREINVNKHLWAASLDILSVFPIQAVDPFSGVISTGWGRVSGAAPAYRATVYVTGPALEARSLRVAVFRLSGGRAVAVSDEVAAQIEDSILTRARQLRIADQNRG